MSLPLPRLLSVVHVFCRRAIANGESDEGAREAALRSFDESMDWPQTDEERRASWGETADAAAAQQAMLSMVGGG